MTVPFPSFPARQIIMRNWTHYHGFYKSMLSPATKTATCEESCRVTLERCEERGPAGVSDMATCVLLTFPFWKPPFPLQPQCQGLLLGQYPSHCTLLPAWGSSCSKNMI